MLWCLTRITFAFLLLLQGTELRLQKNNAAMLAKKGYRLEGDVIRSIHVPSSLECAQHCLADEQCVSLNYQSSLSFSLLTICELNNSTKYKKPSSLTEDAMFTYYDLLSQNGAKTDDNSEKSDSSVGPIYYRSCLEVQSINGSTGDGEYKLHLKYPSCNRTVEVYCADMNTSSPKEYITLKAGETNNFSKKNYVGHVKQNVWASSTTSFSKPLGRAETVCYEGSASGDDDEMQPTVGNPLGKMKTSELTSPRYELHAYPSRWIRVNPDLTVVREDYRFARVTWYYLSKTFIPYGSAADCTSTTCSVEKQGKFNMDLTGTGLRFVTPINWKYSGYPNCQGIQPNSYNIKNKKQVASGNCGGFCGGCNARDLKLEFEEC